MNHPSPEPTSGSRSGPAGAAPLHDVALSVEATARYLADLQRVVRDMARHLATLQTEIQVVCRDTHIEGDRFYHARMRARPVEKAFSAALHDAEKLAADLEKAAFTRRDFADKVKRLPGERKQKEIDKARKKNPAIRPAGPQQPVDTPQPGGYAAPAQSIYDLRGQGRESA
ncbi:hypothetical protein [Streptomyces clavuligerus]|uniref:Uncharacterized protein n=1 Tax=Streptomyces clavuligerus TaxID=1901 RepID=B5GUN7_STRCL|nr:hypothetical protein [Streptomyces clavuligerus]EDY50033.1 conserved hypothetical protein [Streptomyces clavuligerus]EFG03742.1 Hypothetical protein SCLAV_p0251 [Streptomyces clavuligerus]MBY6307719.1 hypothetical protein [Streptomyces clavuligerus]QCS09731.1 hypothetical protein CRV15_29360 [Streptomyces clavuligerus]QPJ98223.1 hypothetical protein GE265_35030 [Streptomyces clavuligerus]